MCLWRLQASSAMAVEECKRAERTAGFTQQLRPESSASEKQLSTTRRKLKGNQPLSTRRPRSAMRSRALQEGRRKGGRPEKPRRE